MKDYYISDSPSKCTSIYPYSTLLKKIFFSYPHSIDKQAEA